MPNARGRILYLAKLPEYDHVKPYIAAVPVRSGLDLKDFQVTNLQWDERGVDFIDIRPFPGNFKLDECGFEVLLHESKYKGITTLDDVEGYQRETEHVLKKLLSAEEVICFEFKSRKNIDYDQQEIDLADPLQYMKPARDVHADYTFDSGPITSKRVLKEHHLEQYMKPGYRFRIVNTWRSAVPKITDLPLAVCDFRSVAADEVLASDRVRPDFTGEIFHVQFNPNHKWYFLDSMTPAEPWLIMSYDSMAGNQARFCPHVTFHPEGLDDGYRESYETRNLVITKA